MPETSLQSVKKFDEAIVDTQTGASDVDDFVYKTLHQVDWAAMLQPAPMSVAIFGQLSLVAATTDFKLARPTGAQENFKFIKYPDSFRATIVQLVNTGVLALNKSYANFDEIKKRCAGIKPGVNNIVSLLLGDEDYTPEQNNAMIGKYLPNQIKRLSGTIDACLAKAKETDAVFHDLLSLTMEIHEACTLTQSKNEEDIKRAERMKTVLETHRQATEENKKLCAEDLERSIEDFKSSREQFNKAADDMPSGLAIAGLHLLDRVTSVFGDPSQVTDMLSSTNKSEMAQKIALNVAKKQGNSLNEQLQSYQPGTSGASDPGYKQAVVIHQQALILESFVSGENIDWDQATGASGDKSGCGYVSASLSLVVDRLGKRSAGGGNASEVTTQALELAKEGVRLSDALADAAATPKADIVSKLKTDILAWTTQASKFAAEAGVVLNTNTIGSSPFMTPDESPASSEGAASMVLKSSQFRLSMADAQLTASRESQRIATDRMMETTKSLAEIMGKIASLDMKKLEWGKIREILEAAINLLCDLKSALESLVYFFTTINNIVSVNLSSSAKEFIDIINDATAPGAVIKSVGGITIDRWACQMIYAQAIQATKVSRLVENIADVYVEIYSGNIQPGVKQLLELGKLIGSGDHAEINAAGADILIWADSAKERIGELLGERMRRFEGDIASRAQQLAKSIGGILPPNKEIKQITDQAQEDRVKEVSKKKSRALL